jgi:hypothetical protein
VAWLIEHKHVESAYFHLENSYALEQSLKWNPTISTHGKDCQSMTVARIWYGEIVARLRAKR